MKNNDLMKAITVKYPLYSVYMTVMINGNGYKVEVNPKSIVNILMGDTRGGEMFDVDIDKRKQLIDLSEAGDLSNETLDIINQTDVSFRSLDTVNEDLAYDSEVDSIIQSLRALA